MTRNDPQKWYSFVVLLANSLCFVIITTCYTLITIKTRSSTASMKGNRQLRTRNTKLQFKISLIIMTDFLCWIPFIIVCLLHYFEIYDAIKLYPVFSILILPINSVVNPLLFANTVANFLMRPWRPVIRTMITVLSSTRTQNASVHVGSQAATAQETEL